MEEMKDVELKGLQEGCRKGRNLLQLPTKSSHLLQEQFLAPNTRSSEDSAIQEHPLDTVGHTDPPHHVLLTTYDYPQ